MKFDPTKINENLKYLWKRPMENIGMERNEVQALDEIVSQRVNLSFGYSLLNDDKQFPTFKNSIMVDRGSMDPSLSNMVVRILYTNCGDRANDGEPSQIYREMIVSRFGLKNKRGITPIDDFSPPGGGAGSGRLVSHIDRGHNKLKQEVKDLIFGNNPYSAQLSLFDLQGHVGKYVEDDGTIKIGTFKEYECMEPRNSCGAVIGTLKSYDDTISDLRRIAGDLGDKNMEYLRKGVRTPDGTDITYALASAIVALRGMEKTIAAIKNDADEKTVTHITSGLLFNEYSNAPHLAILAVATIFDGTITFKGLGLDAEKLAGELVPHKGGLRLKLSYNCGDGLKTGADLPIITTQYQINNIAHT